MNPKPALPSATQPQARDVEKIKSELVSRLDQLIAELFGNAAKRTGNLYSLGSISGEPGLSLKITRTGSKAGLWNDFNPAGSGSGDVLTLIERRFNLDFKGAVAWAINWLGRGGSPAGAGAQPVPATSLPQAKQRPANREYLARRQKNLHDNTAALAWLYGRGIRASTAKHFQLGLSEPYTDREGVEHRDALVAPLMSADGLALSASVYYNVPGVTLNPANDNGWMKGSPQTYYAEPVGDHTSVFVCEGLKDLWRTWQALREDVDAPKLLLISSTHGSGIPEEWHRAEFWERFELVFLGHDNDAAGDQTARRIAQVAGHETLRVRPPKQKGKDWTDFWQQGGTVAEFQSLLAEANVIGEEISSGGDSDTGVGRHDYRPVDISTAFHRGHLYYPVRVLSNETETVTDAQGNLTTQVVAKVETVVVRSDRTVHAVRQEPAPKGTPPEERVLRLTDGTLMEAKPKASLYSTWSWSSIKAYCAGRSKARALGAILAEVNAYLRRSVWLPYDADYDMLTLLVPVTYAQAVFQSVPMVLVVGPAGSGKSALGRAMVRVCANAASVGQISAAGVARLIHETKGFVVMDDLESVGSRSGKDGPTFNELIQALKLSYNKETSWKIWTDVSRGMRVERLNFFGVKMINNTTGTDNILGSRMLRVQTRKMPDALKAELGNFDHADPTFLNQLRDELHTWTFENVALIDDTYKRLFPVPTDRATEIAAPLRVFAEIAGDERLAQGLDQALSASTESISDPDDPVEVMKEAIRRLVREGYREVSTTHVVLEMKTLVDDNTDRRLTNEIVQWENPAWVGRQLRTHDIIEVNSQGTRQWLFGKSLRIYPVKEHFVVEVLDGQSEAEAAYVERNPTDFCAGCAQCRYRNAGCPIMEPRLAEEKKRGGRPSRHQDQPRGH